MKNNVQINKNYRPSTNIAFDVDNKELIEGFIPTTTSLDLLEFLLQPVLYKDSSTVRSHLLTGSYGKGKSYTVLLAIDLLKNGINPKNKSNLVEKIKNKRPHLAEKINRIGLNNSTRLLPVVIKGGFSSLTIALSSALSESLERENISDIVLESNFTTALNYMNKWQKDYKHAFEMLIDFIKDKKYTEKSLRLALENKNEEAIKLFIELFPKITNGSEFNMISEFQVIDDYKKVSKNLNKHGYSGLFIVYDEFSKFLESVHDSMSEGDIKLLQDLAELSNASTVSSQIHLTLISHKIPTSYFSDSKVINEWEAISGRFDVKDMFGFNEQEYEIIEGMLDINDSYVDKIIKKEISNPAYKNFEAKIKELDIFSGNFKNIVKNYFPLHPLALYILPRLSEQIAQNERSIFSFIVSSAPNSLSSFILNSANEDRLFVDNIYDYFQPLFRNAPKDSLMFKLYLMVDSVLNKESISDLAKKLVRSIAILIVLNDEKIPATFDSLLLIYGMSSYSTAQLEKANSELRKYGVVREADGNNQYLPFAIDPQIQASITRYSNTLKKNSVLQNELIKHGFAMAYFPRRYNDKHSITRFFKLEIITEITGYDDIYKKYLSQKKLSNGVVFAILDHDLDKVKSIIKQAKDLKLCFFLVPKEEFDIEKLTKTLFEYKAIKEKMIINKTNSADKEAVLRFIMNDDYNSIKEALNVFKNPSSELLECYQSGEIYTFEDRVDISNLCSNLYEKYLSETVVFNREDINLERPSTIAVKQRDVVVNCLLEKNITRILKERKTSQVYSIFSSLKYYSNIITIVDENRLQYEFSSAHNNFEKPLNYLKEQLLKSASIEVSMKDVISTLVDVDGGMGLKKGIVPFFLAIACSKYDKKLVFFKDNKEANINASLFNSIINDPLSYRVRMKNWGANEESYINTLCNNFNIQNYNSNVYELLLQSMRKWFQLLPLQTRVLLGHFSEVGEVIQFNKKELKLLKIIDRSLDNPYSTIMEKIPSKINSKLMIDEKLANQIIDIFNNINNSYEKSIKNIKQYIFKKLSFNSNDVSWIVNMHSWVDSLTESQKMNLSKPSLKIIDLISNSNNEELLFNQLTYSLIGLRFSDWGLNSIDLLNQALEKITEEISNSDINIDSNTNSDVAIINWLDENGNKIEKKIGLSTNDSVGRMVSDEITSIIEDMGSSISKEDINKILLDIIINS